MSSVFFARPFLEQVLWWQTCRGLRAAATAQSARVMDGRGIFLPTQCPALAKAARQGKPHSAAPAVRRRSDTRSSLSASTRRSGANGGLARRDSDCKLRFDNNPRVASGKTLSNSAVEPGQPHCSQPRHQSSKEPPCPSTTVNSTRSARTHRRPSCRKHKNKL